MALSDPREVFPILGGASGEGVVLSAAVEDDLAAGLQSAPVLPAKDIDTGELKFIPIQGNKVLVDTEAPNGASVGDAVSGTVNPTSETTLVTIPLTVDLVYSQIEASIACRRGLLARLVHNDNGAEEDLGFAVIEAGQYTVKMGLKNDRIVAGSTGTQELLLKAQLFTGPNAPAYGSVAAFEEV